MTSTTFRTIAVIFVCHFFSVGCNRSGNADIAKAEADAEAARADAIKEKARADAAAAERAKEKARADIAEGELAKLQAAQAKPKPVDDDRRAAEWVLRVEGNSRVVVDGVSHEIKKGGKLPDGDLKLVSIAINDCPKATDDGLEYLRGLKNLRGLTLNWETGITKFEFLAELPNLENLGWGNRYGSIKDKDLAYIKVLTKLKQLNLGGFFGNERVTDAGLENFKGLKQLQVLSLENLKSITDAGLQHIKELPDLQSLNLVNTKITDAGLEHLKGLSKLESLALHGTKVTDAGVKSLQAALPKCNITSNVKK